MLQKARDDVYSYCSLTDSMYSSSRKVFKLQQKAHMSRRHALYRVLLAELPCLCLCACASVSTKFHIVFSSAKVLHSYFFGRQILKVYRHENRDDVEIEAVLHKIRNLRDVLALLK